MNSVNVNVYHSPPIARVTRTHWFAIDPCLLCSNLLFWLRHCFLIFLVNTSHYKCLGITFCSSGNPSAYMPAAKHTMAGAYTGLQRCCCVVACGSCHSLRRLRPHQPHMLVNCGVLNLVMPHSVAFLPRSTRNYSAKQLIRAYPGTDTAGLLAELGHLSLHQRWL